MSRGRLSEVFELAAACREMDPRVRDFLVGVTVKITHEVSGVSIDSLAELDAVTRAVAGEVRSRLHRLV